MSAPAVSVLVRFGPETPLDPAGLLADLRAQEGVDLDIVLIDHTDDAALSGLDLGADVRVVRETRWSEGAALKAGLQAARHDHIALREPGSRTDAAWTLRAIDALGSKQVVTSNYFLSTADGRMAYNIDPARDGEAPPPGWSSALLVTRAFLEGVSEVAFVPALLQAYRAAVRDDQTAHVEDPLFSVAADWFAVQRFDSNWKGHLLRVLEGEDFEATTPWMSALVTCGGDVAQARAALGRIACQVLPRNTFEVVVIDTGDGAVADALEAVECPVRMRAVRSAGSGRVAALNTGLAYAEGIAIVCLDDQLRLFPDTFEQHIRASREDQLRELVVLGTVEASAEAQQTPLGQILGDGSVELGVSLTAGNQDDFGALRLRNLSLARATLDAIGGFGVGLEDAAAAGDLAQRLYERGAVLAYRDNARAIRTDGLSVAALGAARRATAQARVALVERHPDLAEQFPATTLAELTALIEENARSRHLVEAAAGALADFQVATLDPIGDDWRELGATLVGKARALITHLDRLWEAEGLAAGLAAAGVSSLREIAARQPEHVPGSRSERWLLIPQAEQEAEWLMALGRYLTGADADADTTLILLANAGDDGCSVELIQNACAELTQRILPPRSGQWAHVVIVDETTRDRPLYRLLGACQGLLTTGSAFEEGIADQIALCSATTDNGDLFTHRTTGGIEPYPYATVALRRVLAWPDWSETDLDALLLAFRDARAAYGPLALCLRYHAETDPEAPVALGGLDAAYQRLFNEGDDVEVFLFEVDADDAMLPQLGAGVDAVMALPSSEAGSRRDFVDGTCAPAARDANSLLAVLRPLPVGRPAPVTPPLTWTL